MKPVLILCLAILCLSVVFSAPAPTGVTGLTIATTALGVSDFAALAGAGFLTKAGILALIAQQQ